MFSKCVYKFSVAQRENLQKEKVQHKHLSDHPPTLRLAARLGSTVSNLCKHATSSFSAGKSPGWKCKTRTLQHLRNAVTPWHSLCMRMCVSPTAAKQYPPSQTTKARSLPLYGNVTDSTVGSMHLAELLWTAAWQKKIMFVRRKALEASAEKQRARPLLVLVPASFPEPWSCKPHQLDESKRSDLS